MSIESLRINNCRILTHLEINPDPGFNLIVGDNGAGKSTLLEAIYLIGTGRSFRTPLVSSVVTKGKTTLIISAEIKSLINGVISVGMERGKGCNRLHINRVPTQRLSAVAEQLPLQIITPDSINLVIGSPKGRRSFLDWGMFHVEQKFLAISKKYRDSLRQRNALLKRKDSSDIEISYWNSIVAESGEQLSNYRENYFREVIELYQSNIAEKLPIPKEFDLSFSYRRGWKEGESLLSAIEKSYAREKIVGYTVVGPHEADLSIKVNGVVAKTILSRGEAKLLSVSLLLSQLSHLFETTGKMGVVLLDDIFSELDPVNRERVLEYLIECKYQVFATTTESETVPLKDKKFKMFHVKHGGLI
ncbi:MAG: DNA replication/repair protein RecF [Thiotrichales bacterium]|nr:DNA replication/repair protein RecF [Thiotrichales bacterium]